jgi:hypothetical protein
VTEKPTQPAEFLVAHLEAAPNPPLKSAASLIWAKAERVDPWSTPLNYLLGNFVEVGRRDSKDRWRT